MGKFDKFKVDLRGMKAATATFSMDIDNEYFANIDGPEVQKGKAEVLTTVTAHQDKFDIRFDIHGEVIVTCDRCLDEMELPIHTTGTLSVKLGKAYGEEGDTIVVPEKDGYVNVAWYIYEFVALAIPIKHVHAPCKCNRDMATRLDKISVEEGEDGEFILPLSDDDTANDPRWDALKEIMDN
jgi:uncharacterized metal-binding protein YceD (DUF177 family)